MISNGLDNISLALFTTLSPAGIITFICAAIPLLFFHLDEPVRVRLTRYLSIPFSIVLIGFIASATHLGTPSNALHVFSGVGRSPLSNEVLCAVVFLLLAGSHWMLSFKENFPLALSRLWLAVSCVAGIALITMTSFAYSVETVITWNTPLTPINLWFSAILPGTITSILVCRYAEVEAPRYFFVLLLLSILALVIGSGLLFVHQESLASISNNEFSAGDLLPHYPSMIFGHVACGIIGIAFAVASFKKTLSKRSRMILLLIACLFLFVAVFIPRIAFYQLHMTAGF